MAGTIPPHVINFHPSYKQELFIKSSKSSPENAILSTIGTKEKDIEPKYNSSEILILNLQRFVTKAT